jgi:hypothetical protein
MARGNNGQQIFPRNSDFAAFLDALTQVRTNAATRSQRVPLRELLQTLAARAGLEPETLRRKGRTAAVFTTRELFICHALRAEGYFASELAEFLGCHPSNVSRALQKNLAS